jgi:predicted nucleic acid-binding protein
MNVLIDTNVVFDVVEKRQPHYAASNQVLCLCRRRVLAGMVAYHTIANVFYQYGKPVVPFLRDALLPHVRTVSADAPLLMQALAWGLTDLEDALQAAAARANGAAFIISRNVRDFRLCPVPTLTPSDYLARFHPPQ